MLVFGAGFLKKKEDGKQDEEQDGLSEHPADVEKRAVAELVIKTVRESKCYQ